MKNQHFESRKWTGELRTEASYPYLLYLPHDYEKEPEKCWPAILFLHGIGERGDGNLETLFTTGLPRYLSGQEDFPFVVICPQCPLTTKWFREAQGLSALVDAVLKEYRIDEDRFYLTGLSMGGYGTWMLAASYPEKFAAAAPICGGGLGSYGDYLKELPIWAFHGDADPLVPVEESIKMVNKINELGGHAKLTVYPGVEHDSWTRTYENPELYQWFLQHTRKREEIK